MLGQSQIELMVKEIQETPFNTLDDAKSAFIKVNQCEGMIRVLKHTGIFSDQDAHVYEVALTQIKVQNDLRVFELAAKSIMTGGDDELQPYSNLLHKPFDMHLNNEKSIMDFNLDEKDIGHKSIKVNAENPKRKIEDLKFISLNKVNNILEDIETHLKYGRDFNYEKDFKQVEELVNSLKLSIESF